MNQTPGRVSEHPHLSAHYESPAHSADATAAIADLLARGPIEAPEDVEQLKSVENKELLRSNAAYMYEVLEQATAALRSRINQGLEADASGEKTRVAQLLEAADAGDEEQLQKLGLSFEYAWLNTVVATMLRGHPPVEIETVGPYAAAHLNPDTNQLEIDISKIEPDEMAGILMAGILRKLDPVAHHTRLVSLIDEFNNYKTERQFTEAEQDAYVVAMAEFYGQAGALKPDDEPGKDFVILRESELAERVIELEKQLGESNKGDMVTMENGAVYFRPDATFVDGLQLHSKNRIKELKNKGVLLRKSDGTPTCQAMDATGFLNPINSQMMHVVMIDKNMESQQDKTYTLLAALGIVDQASYHNILVDSESLSPEMIAYGVSRVLQRHVNNFMKMLEASEE